MTEARTQPMIDADERIKAAENQILDNPVLAVKVIFQTVEDVNRRMGAILDTIRNLQKDMRTHCHVNDKVMVDISEGYASGSGGKALSMVPYWVHLVEQANQQEQKV